MSNLFFLRWAGSKGPILRSVKYDFSGAPTIIGASFFMGFGCGLLRMP